MTSKRVLLLVITLVIATAACATPAGVASPAATGGGPTAISTAASPVAATTSTPATTGPVQTKPAPKTPDVDLTFTGMVAFVANGTKGTCQIGMLSDGSFVFGFFMTDADYPGLGSSFEINEDAATHKVSMKWVFGDAFIAGVIPGGVTLSPDHRTMTLDSDLPAGVGRSEHLKGSIACP